MPAVVYRNLRSVQLLDGDGNSLGDALDADGGKSMTRQHANNAKEPARSPSGARFLSKTKHPDSKDTLKTANPENRVTQLAEILSVDPKAVRPETSGRTADDTDNHAKNIKNDIRSLVESIAIGGPTEIPKQVVMPLLNSMAEYMNKTIEDIDGKPLLEGTLKIQENAAAAVERRANTTVKTKNPKTEERPSEGTLRWQPLYH